jgi:hypothetical protein
MRVLVVGATGILRPAAATLAAEGHRVTGVARDASSVPTGVAGLSADATVPAFVADGSWDAALVYGPAVSSASLEAIRAAVTGPVVRVLTSEAAAPDRASALSEPYVLQLGWVPLTRRWHTAAEVSSAALQVLEDGDSRGLGVVRPWEDRP